MKVSDCCRRGPMNDEGLCPNCREHCEWIEEDLEEDDFRLGESVDEWERRTGYVGMLHSEALLRLQSQVQRLLFNSVETAKARRMTMACTVCFAVKHVNDFATPDVCTACANNAVSGGAGAPYTPLHVLVVRRMEDSMCEEAESGRVYKWEIEPHPYTNEFDVYVTDSDEEARQAILHAAEMYLWDSNDGDDDGPHGPTRTLKVTHNTTGEAALPAKGDA